MRKRQESTWRKRMKWVKAEEFVETIRKRWDDSIAERVAEILQPRKMVQKKVAERALNKALAMNHADNLEYAQTLSMTRVRLPGT